MGRVIDLQAFSRRMVPGVDDGKIVWVRRTSILTFSRQVIIEAAFA